MEAKEFKQEWDKTIKKKRWANLYLKDKESKYSAVIVGDEYKIMWHRVILLHNKKEYVGRIDLGLVREVF
jgi:hypothetical protein